jgi:predicted ArsR family transcriptional regulator
MMSDTTNATIKKALKDSPGATAEGVAGAAGISPSTARKALAQLVEAGEVTRVEGGREAGRRLPDRYSLDGTLVPESDATHSVT